MEQHVFSVEAALPDDVDAILNQEEWPSDDSGDDDYDPDRIDNDDVSRVCSADKSSDDDNDDANSNYSLLSLDDEVLDDDESCKIIRNTGLESTSGSGSGTDCEFVSGRRQRRSVDYRKLYDVSTTYMLFFFKVGIIVLRICNILLFYRKCSGKMHLQMNK